MFAADKAPPQAAESMHGRWEPIEEPATVPAQR